MTLNDSIQAALFIIRLVNLWLNRLWLLKHLHIALKGSEANKTAESLELRRQVELLLFAAFEGGWKKLRKWGKSRV